MTTAQRRIPQGPFRQSHTEGLLVRSVEDTYYKWPSRDYVLPSSLPTHDKIDRAAEKAIELADHYKSQARGGSIRDPCVNILYKVTGGDSCKYWSTGMVSAAKFDSRDLAADRKSTRLNSSHLCASRMPSSA